jgi:ribonucleotide monophosphatase NagD (HAD superfamily)
MEERVLKNYLIDMDGVLTGIASRDDLGRYPYRPSRVVESLSEIEI